MFSGVLLLCCTIIFVVGLLCNFRTAISDLVYLFVFKIFITESKLANFPNNRKRYPMNSSSNDHPVNEFQEDVEEVPVVEEEVVQYIGVSAHRSESSRHPANLLAAGSSHASHIPTPSVSTDRRALPVNATSNHRERDVTNHSRVYEEASAAAALSATAGAVSYAPGQAMFNWQASKGTLKERLVFIFNKEILSDVHFIVGKGTQQQRVPAHKFVLSIGSAVFDAMFNGAMASTSDEIDLPDVEPAAFLALLRFLYTDDVQIGPETVMTTLYTAKKYAVPALEKACVDFLKLNLSSDNAFMLLTQARLFDEPQLANMCLETIDKFTSEALAAEGFTDIDHDTLCVVLERDTLRIREAKLFSSVIRWAEQECIRQNLPVTPENQRLLMSRALYLIRFPLMTVEEFAGGAAQSAVLTDREIVSLFLYFTVNPKPTVMFPDVPRCCITGKEQVICRFQQTESRWGYSGTSDRIRFVVDRRVFIVGFGLYGSIHGPSDYDAKIQIIHTGTGKILGSSDTKFSSDGTPNTSRVMFKVPVEVAPNTNYTAAGTLKGPDSHYGTKGMRKITVDCPSGGKVTFQFLYAAGNNNGTSVEDGQIPEIIFYT